MPVSALSRRVHVEHVMGTVVSLDARSSWSEGAVDAAMGWLREVDARFSPYRPDSEISRLDRGDLLLADAAPDVRAVLDRCAALWRETYGYFDIRAGGRLDPSALVKGWATQRAADLLRSRGLTDFCLSVGGDVVTRGGALPEPRWTVGVQHPRDRSAIATRIEARNLAIATSGAYERGTHIRDPHSAAPPRDVLSVTVCGPDLGTADAYSTAAFAMGGARGPAWTTGLAGYEAMTILADGTVLSTAGFPELRA